MYRVTIYERETIPNSDPTLRVITYYAVTVKGKVAEIAAKTGGNVLVGLQPLHQLPEIPSKSGSQQPFRHQQHVFSLESRELEGIVDRSDPNAPTLPGQEPANSVISEALRRLSLL